MNVLYICKVSEYQASGNQIDIPKKVALNFFNVPESYIEQSLNYSINICHENNLRAFEMIEIQPATNLRFSTKLNSFLLSNGVNLADGDLLVFEKLMRSYCVRCIKKDDSKYLPILELFDEGEKHMLLSSAINNNQNNNLNAKTLQQIYYGAPGTGKSHSIDKLVTEENSIRTTFHPDSDYASFVGCYKPVAKIVDGEKKEITYDFVPQAFTRAYIEAWKDTSKPYYLVIEEINRGNCAQIFGDIFQLLDRGEDGFSSYKITPDTDLQQYLAEQFAKVDIADADIKAGRKMQLPNNLHILATMNTSDQSLFPIDSAFKRRWEWKYIPIKNEGKNHKIVVDGAKYDWFAFMKLVNDRIENVTDSEDKQIGYWFAKANEKDEISAETLVSKVIFYLWNDVFKDYAHSNDSLFHTDKRKYKFREFYHENGDVNTILLKQFLKELGLKDETSQTNEVLSAEENQEPEQPAEE